MVQQFTPGLRVCQVLAEERPPVTACQVSIQYTKAELASATSGFSVEQQLGAGSFGEVFRAITDGRQVAVKRLRQVATRDVRQAYENEVWGGTVLCSHVGLLQNAVSNPHNPCVSSPDGRVVGSKMEAIGHGG